MTDEPYGMNEPTDTPLMPSANDAPQNIAEQFAAWSEQFDELCYERHEAGAAEYGHFTFIENDVVRMMAEELADTANYCRMQFIKLMMLQSALVEQLNGSEFELKVNEFKGVKDVGWRKR